MSHVDGDGDVGEDSSLPMHPEDAEIEHQNREFRQEFRGSVYDVQDRKILKTHDQSEKRLCARHGVLPGPRLPVLTSSNSLKLEHPRYAFLGCAGLSLR